MGTAWKTPAHLVLIAAVGFLVYLPALDASFHLDDSPSIRDNQAIRSLKIVPLWNFWPTRFLNYLSLAVNYRAGGLAPRGYHAVNVAVHLLNALVLYGVLRLLFPGRSAPPLVGALLFVLHPLQTQAVTYIVQRATSLASGFCLFSVFLYLWSRPGPARPRKFRGAAYVLSLASCLAAMLTKEFTIVLPFLVLLVELKAGPPGARPAWGRLLPYFCCLLVVPVLILAYSDKPCYNDSGQLEWLKRAGMIENAARGRGVQQYRYFSTQCRVLITYVRLVLLPVGQRLEYDYPWYSTVLAPAPALSAAGLAALLLLALRAGRSSPLVSLGLLWFLVALIPESSVVPILDVAVEHRLYLPLAGVAVAAAAYVSSAPPARLRTVGLVAVLFCLGILSYNRNRVYLDPITLWEDNLAKAPGKARVHGNLGKAYLDAGRYRSAAARFERMIELDPTYAGAYNNLAVINIDHLHDYEAARRYIRKSLEVVPDYPAAYLNLGVIDLNNMRLLPAIRNFERVLELDPENLLAYYNLGACYFNLASRDRSEAAGLAGAKKKEEAARKLEEAAQALERSREYLERGRALWPAEPKFAHLLGLIARARGDEALASRCFREAERLQAARGE